MLAIFDDQFDSQKELGKYFFYYFDVQIFVVNE
jgi:hypothetical protein